MYWTDYLACTSCISWMAAKHFFIMEIECPNTPNCADCNLCDCTGNVYPVHTHCLLLHLMTSCTSYLQPSSPRSQYSSTSWLLQFQWLSAALAVHVCMPDVCLLDEIRALGMITVHFHFTWTAQQLLLVPSEIPHTHSHTLILHLSGFEQVDIVKFDCVWFLIVFTISDNNTEKHLTSPVMQSQTFGLC